MLNKVLASAIAGLLLIAAGGTYSVATQLASLSAQVDAMSTVISNLDNRVLYLERERYGPR